MVIALIIDKTLRLSNVDKLVEGYISIKLKNAVAKTMLFLPHFMAKLEFRKVLRTDGKVNVQDAS